MRARLLALVLLMVACGNGGTDVDYDPFYHGLSARLTFTTLCNSADCAKTMTLVEGDTFDMEVYGTSLHRYGADDCGTSLGWTIESGDEGLVQIVSFDMGLNGGAQCFSDNVDGGLIATTFRSGAGGAVASSAAETTFKVFDENHELVDTLPVRVQKPGRYILETVEPGPYTKVSAIGLAVNQQLEYAILPANLEGEELSVGSDAKMELPDLSIVSFADPGGDRRVGENWDSLVGIAPGTTQLKVTMGDTVQEFPVTVSP
jgi:hypothetical protein